MNTTFIELSCHSFVLVKTMHCVKSVRIQDLSGPYFLVFSSIPVLRLRSKSLHSVQMLENTIQKKLVVISWGTTMRGVFKEIFLWMSKNSQGNIHGGVNKMASHHFASHYGLYRRRFRGNFRKLKFVESLWLAASTLQDLSFLWKFFHNQEANTM